MAAGSLLDQTPVAARETLRRWVAEQGHPAYRAGQILRRLWQAPLENWSGASDLPRALRAELEALFPLPRLTADTIQQSADGTRKYLWRLEDNEAIESVLIPSGNRRTLCISSQAGCALGCTFCATGRMGFRRNLTPFEIAGQIREVVLRDPSEKPTNIVFMGMGEPLLNWASVDTTLSILTARGFGSAPGISPYLRWGYCRASPSSRRSGAVQPGDLAPRHHLAPAIRHHADREEV